MKRILALLLAMIMTLSLCACGNNTADNTDGGTTANTESSTTGTEDTTGNTEKPDETTSATDSTEESTSATEGTQAPTEDTKPTEKPTESTKQPDETTSPTTNPPVTNPPSTSTESANCKHTNTRNGNCISELYCMDCCTVVGPKNPNIHPKGQEPGLYNVKPATCAEEGYTGDWKCLSCHALITQGTSIPKTTTHQGGRAGCSSLAICSICGVSYGNYDKSNHTRADGKVNWETRNKVASTCENGYSGDIYCLDCGGIVSMGKLVPASGCVSEDAIPATCCTYRSCRRCGQVWEWMGYDTKNHIGATEVRNAKEATCCKGYTGDIYCLACNKIKSKGKDISPAWEHAWQIISNGMYKCKDCGAIEIRAGS